MKIMTERQFYEELHEREKVRQDIQELKRQIKELEKQVNLMQTILMNTPYVSTTDRSEMIITWLDGTER